ncbi:MAG: N-acetylmuramoyl-L-alanine amidase [uncultured Acidimicrobiales bacterium]|uniref:N-acetylmuramoyl-L-alanine amidase n=1 Tax=uncultured Acidimicrobiales bacterium TaxID=310071 RepID=A0A6J4HED9_9ACTN|nr:MAG: N-acetylmuramoyl-L-alanine amidase [uncultured Acidimicrobiales bacterium]
MRRATPLALLLAVGCLLASCSDSREPPSGNRLEPLAEPAVDGQGVEPVEPAPPLAEGGPRLIVSNKGVVLPVLGPAGDAFRVVTPCGNEVAASGTPLTSIDVVIDPGHGGEETGAVGPGGLREKDLNLVVAAHAARSLQAQDVSVLLTRRADYRMTLAARGLVVEAIRPKVFVSIHHNAGATQPSPVGPGTEVYHQHASAESKRLSGLVYEDVKGYLAKARNVAWVAAERPGVVARVGASGNDYYGVLRRTQGTPAALIESAFISNRAEEALLQRRDVQKAEGEAIARGIVRYLRSPEPGSGFVAPFSSSAPAGRGGGAKSCQDPTL